MGNYTPKLERKARSEMNPGEQLMVAVRALPSGGLLAAGLSAGAASMGAGGGAIEGLARGAANAAEQRTEGAITAANVTLAKQMVLGLTNSRIMLWNRSSITGAPKDLIQSIPLEYIAGLSAERKSLLHLVTITFIDGATLQLEVPKIDGTDRLMEAWHNLRPGSIGGSSAAA